MVECPICSKEVNPRDINAHIDSACNDFKELDTPPLPEPNCTSSKKANVSAFFQPSTKRKAPAAAPKQEPLSQNLKPPSRSPGNFTPTATPQKRLFEDINGVVEPNRCTGPAEPSLNPVPIKKSRLGSSLKFAPLAERMRPTCLDDVYGQDLVGPNGILRGLIEQDRVPSMILWGGSGTGKTTIARCLAARVGSRFVEINSTSSGVSECKKIFAEARGELGLSGRKTIIFCDEIHRFSKSQQDVFLGPVESGHITLIGATTENPSFKVQNALLSRCRTFVLSKLTNEDIFKILEKALGHEEQEHQTPELIDTELLQYLAAFSDGDARTALNLLELAMSLSNRPSMTKDEIKSSLTKTLVYDRAGDQHYDTISAFHKSIRGSDANAALYYLARMLQSGEDPLYIARRIVIVASEDVGLADNSMLSLATSAYTAVEKIGMPECRIPLAHATVALCLAPKSTRSYRALNNAFIALQEPGVAALPIPTHLRNAPTKLMKELGFGDQYKYNPNYKDGKVRQNYLPTPLIGRSFLDDRDLGTEIDLEADPL